LSKKSKSKKKKLKKKQNSENVRTHKILERNLTPYEKQLIENEKSSGYFLINNFFKLKFTQSNHTLGKASLKMTGVEINLKYFRRNPDLSSQLFMKCEE
jgi:hypothetical protein